MPELDKYGKPIIQDLMNVTNVTSDLHLNNPIHRLERMKETYHRDIEEIFKEIAKRG